VTRVPPDTGRSRVALRATEGRLRVDVVIRTGERNRHNYADREEKPAQKTEKLKEGESVEACKRESGVHNLDQLWRHPAV